MALVDSVASVPSPAPAHPGVHRGAVKDAGAVSGSEAAEDSSKESHMALPLVEVLGVVLELALGLVVDSHQEAGTLRAPAVGQAEER